MNDTRKQDGADNGVGSTGGSAWLPLPSAPRDGTRILAATKYWCGVVYYGGGDSGWRCADRQLSACWPEPDYWMPLPPLPNKPAQTPEGRSPGGCL